jgi:TPR repeat protein
MYEQGQGVPQDDKEAVKWYRLAALPRSFKSTALYVVRPFGITDTKS